MVIRKRKTSPKVIGGLVQRKNNHVRTARLGYVIDRVSPGIGYRHVLKKKDIHDFTDIIPDWDNHAIGLEAVILDAGDESSEGLYRHYAREDTGIIWLGAWPEHMWLDLDPDYFKTHQIHFELLGVRYEKNGDRWCGYFSESQAKAFTLLHIFLHELGHHIDKKRQLGLKGKKGGEEFAERYANETCELIWPLYIEKFGKP